MVCQITTVLATIFWPDGAPWVSLSFLCDILATFTRSSLSTLSAQSEESRGSSCEVADRLGLAPPSAPNRAAHGGEVRPRVLGNVASAPAAH